MKNNMLSMIGLVVALALTSCSDATQEQVVPTCTKNAALVSSDASASAVTSAASALKAENMETLEWIIESAQDGQQAVIYLNKNGVVDLRETRASDLVFKPTPICQGTDKIQFAKCVDVALNKGLCVYTRKVDGVYTAYSIPCME